MALGDWRSRLRDADFRGADFKVVTSDTGIGRRNVIHQYPFRDDPYVEDLGKDADDFVIAAYILQQPPIFNYFAARDKLMDALKTEGPGKLTHPFLGDKTVSVIGKARVRETFQEGGIARFLITFSESLENNFPSPELDLPGEVDASALDAINAAADSFAEVYNAAAADIDDINAGLNLVKTTIQRIKNLPSGVTSLAVGLINGISSTVNEVLSSPCDLANTLAGMGEVFATVGNLTTTEINRNTTGGCSGRIVIDPGESSVDGVDRTTEETQDVETGTSIVEAAIDAATFGERPNSDDASSLGGTLPEITIGSTATAIDASNQAVLIYLTRVSNVMNGAKIAVRIPYENKEQAEEMRDLIIASLDLLLDKLGEDAADSSYSTYGVTFNVDEIYQTVREFRPIFIATMNQIGAGLANIQTYTVGEGVMSSLELAYDKYHDLVRSDEIVIRNQIVHPGFLPNGDDISLLNQ